MAIKEKISTNIYEIYPSDFPDTVEYDQYRADRFKFTIIGFNSDDTPFDFSVYDDFQAQIRVGDPRNRKKQYEFTSANFTLSQTQSTIDSGFSAMDELHLSDASGNAFDLKVPFVWLDIKGTQNDLDPQTFIKIRINIESNVTRQNG